MNQSTITPEIFPISGKKSVFQFPIPLIATVRNRFLLECADRYTVKLTEMSREAWQRMQYRYAIQPVDLTPKVYYRITDNWLELTVRFVVGEHVIRDLKR